MIWSGGFVLLACIGAAMSATVLEEIVTEEFRAKDWCDDEVFDREGLMCCYGKINSRPDYGSKGTHKCCGFTAFSSSDKMCCGGAILFRPTYPYDPKPVHKCCGQQALNSNRDMCCRGTIVERPSYTKGLDTRENDSCCGTISFDQGEFFCRAGQIYPLA